MIYLYTEQFFWWPRLKNFIKILMGCQYRGPQAVEGSLLRGLRDLHIPFVLNQDPKQPVDTACVISGGTKALRWAIRQKQRGIFKHIVAGPIIVVTPNEDDWLVTSPEVDAFVVPSSWVKSWWTSFKPEFSGKIKLWPAGVEDKGNLVKKNGNVLVFQKNSPASLYQSVLSDLKKQGLTYEVIYYGSFSHDEYLKALSRSRFVIYLSQSESQGIALFEAWMAGLPTLVWNRGYMVNGRYRWEDPAISAPFLNDQLGMFFKNQADFTGQLSEFLKRYESFTSRVVALEKFIDAVTTKQYLEIINSL